MYVTDWLPVEATNPAFKCPKCGRSHDIDYREWESADGGHEDYHYHCRTCDHKWWVEGADA